MIFGLVNVSLSLPEWQAVKMTVFAPCFGLLNLVFNAVYNDCQNGTV